MALRRKSKSQRKTARSNRRVKRRGLHADYRTQPVMKASRRYNRKDAIKRAGKKASKVQKVIQANTPGTRLTHPKRKTTTGPKGQPVGRRGIGDPVRDRYGRFKKGRGRK